MGHAGTESSHLHKLRISASRMIAYSPRSCVRDVREENNSCHCGGNGLSPKTIQAKAALWAVVESNEAKARPVSAVEMFAFKEHIWYLSSDGIKDRPLHSSRDQCKSHLFAFH